jgi:hypothetical protein
MSGSENTVNGRPALGTGLLVPLNWGKYPCWTFSSIHTKAFR